MQTSPLVTYSARTKGINMQGSDDRFKKTHSKTLLDVIIDVLVATTALSIAAVIVAIAIRIITWAVFS